MWRDLCTKRMAAVEAFLNEKLLFCFLGFTEVVTKVSKHLGGISVGKFLTADVENEAIENWADLNIT